MNAFSILLVEDSHAHAQLVRLALASGKVPCNLSHVNSGEGALAWLEKAAHAQCLPDLAVVDINLPVMSGHDLLRRMKADDKMSKVPVLIFTTSKSRADIANSRGARASGHIVKPGSFEELKSLLREIVQRGGPPRVPPIDDTH